MPDIRIHREHPVHDVVGSLLVCRVEIPRFGRGPERSNHNPCRIRAQIEALAVQEFGLGQRCSLGATEMDSLRCRWMIILTRAWSGRPLQWPRVVVSLPTREDTITPILRLCSHWNGPDADHPNNSP